MNARPPHRSPPQAAAASRVKGAEKVQRCREGAEKVQRKVQRKIPWYLEGREVLLWPAIVSCGRGGRWVAGVRRCVAARDESEETVRATVRCLW